MCDELCCKLDASDDDVVKDDLTKILIFGATGLTGGAVAEACVSSPWFVTKGFSRAPSSDEFVQMLREKDLKMVTGDTTNYQSVLAAMTDVDVVFLTTHFWETMNTGNEVMQGYNVVNAAMEAGVRHLIYASTDYSPIVSDEKCRFLEGKAKIEVYIVNSGIPYTIVRPGFFYENLLGLFKPHRVGKTDFALPFPMGDHGLNMGSALDLGHCIAKIALRSKMYVYQTINLAAEYCTVNEIVESLNSHFKGYITFFNPLMSLTEYRTMDFVGAEELVTMWAHYRTCSKWDQEDLTNLVPTHFTLKKFIEEREKRLLDVLLDEEDMKSMNWSSSSTNRPNPPLSAQNNSQPRLSNPSPDKTFKNLAMRSRQLAYSPSTFPASRPSRLSYPNTSKPPTSSPSRLPYPSKCPTPCRSRNSPPSPSVSFMTSPDF